MLGFSVLRAAVAALLALVLTWTLVSPVAAEEVPEQAIPSDQIDVASLVPPMESEPFEPEAGTAPVGEFFPGLEAPDLARGVGDGALKPMTEDNAGAFDESTSVEVSRDEFTTTFENEDGSLTTEFSATPVNVEVDGEWVPSETHVERSDDGSWGQDEHPLEPVFGAQADDEGAFSVSKGGYEIAFTLEGAAASPFSKVTFPRQQLETDEITYEEVLDDTDLTYVVTKSGVKESLILAADRYVQLAPSSATSISGSQNASALAGRIWVGEIRTIRETADGSAILIIGTNGNTYRTPGVDVGGVIRSVFGARGYRSGMHVIH